MPCADPVPLLEPWRSSWILMVKDLVEGLRWELGVLWSTQGRLKGMLMGQPPIKR